MSDLLLAAAKKIPGSIRHTILEENFINKATTVEAPKSPMEFLFDVYVEFIDRTYEQSWTCPRCRSTILADFKKLEPFLKQLENGSTGV